MSRRQGFTLVELLVTLAIAAVVLLLGVPSFQDWLLENRLTAEVNELVTALNLTRSEAIERGQRVTLCKSVDGATCVGGGGYEQGWIVFVDTNDNALADSGELVLRVKGAMAENLSLIGNSTVQSYVSYVAGGASRLVNGGFQAGVLRLCAKPKPKGRSIIINSVGRVRVAMLHKCGSS